MTAVAPEAALETALQTSAPVEAAEDDLVLADLLVEEISIDGMCGVY